MKHLTIILEDREASPSAGRRILGEQAAEMLARDVVRAVRQALVFDATDEASLRAHVETVEDACALRAALRDRYLVGFVADGALLPRRSGVDDRPLSSPHTVQFRGQPTWTVQRRRAGRTSQLGARPATEE